MGEYVARQHLELNTKRAMNRMNQPRSPRAPDLFPRGAAQAQRGTRENWVDGCFMLHFEEKTLLLTGHYIAIHIRSTRQDVQVVVHHHPTGVSVWDKQARRDCPCRPTVVDFVNPFRGASGRPGGVEEIEVTEVALEHSSRVSNSGNG